MYELLYDLAGYADPPFKWFTAADFKGQDILMQVLK